MKTNKEILILGDNVIDKAKFHYPLKPNWMYSEDIDDDV